MAEARCLVVAANVLVAHVLVANVLVAESTVHASEKEESAHRPEGMPQFLVSLWTVNGRDGVQLYGNVHNRCLDEQRKLRYEIASMRRLLRLC